MEDKTNYSTWPLNDLLKLKRSNLKEQEELREKAKIYDFAISNHPDIAEQVQLLSNTGGSKRIQLNGLIPKDIRIQYKVTRTWDQEYLKGISNDIGNFPFRSEFVEDIRASKKLKDNDPNTWEVIERGLVTKINERPYISFIDPLKTGEEE